MEGSAPSLPWQVAHPGIDGATPSIPIPDLFPSLLEVPADSDER